MSLNVVLIVSAHYFTNKSNVFVTEFRFEQFVTTMETAVLQRPTCSKRQPLRRSQTGVLWRNRVGQTPRGCLCKCSTGTGGANAFVITYNVRMGEASNLRSRTLHRSDVQDPLGKTVYQTKMALRFKYTNFTSNWTLLWKLFYAGVTFMKSNWAFSEPVERFPD